MKHFNRFLMASLALLLFAGLAAAQQKPQQKAQQIIPLKVEVVLSEYAGAKKISSLPYTLSVNAVSGHLSEISHSFLRLGVRVPIATAVGKSGDKIQYTDVGTTIDCSARAQTDGTYQLSINVARSSVFQPAAKSEMESLHASNGLPIIRSFRTGNTLFLRNGQTDESMIATDPVTGHVLRVSVTLHVTKSAS